LEFDIGTFKSVWRLRDLEGQVIREIRLDNGAGIWSWQKDWIRREGQPLAAVDAVEGTRHLHPDHLGTTRAITDASGTHRSTYHFDPYGEMAASFTAGTEVLLYTGHERDDHALTGGNSGSTDDLDYMHARYYSPMLGRFLRVDSVESREALSEPVLWNRYGYVGTNPKAYVDPDGKERMGIILDLDNKALLEGEITREEFLARNKARGVGLAIGLSLLAGSYATVAGGAALLARLPLIQGFFLRPEVIGAGNAVAAALAEQGTVGPGSRSLGGFELILSQRAVGSTFRQTVTLARRTSSAVPGNLFSVFKALQDAARQSGLSRSEIFINFIRDPRLIKILIELGRREDFEVTLDTATGTLQFVRNIN